MDCTLSFNLAANTGVAWGFFPGHPLLLLVLRVCIIAVLFIYLFCMRSRPIFFFPLFLIIAGAIGNVIDLIWYRHVVDFIHFQFFGWSFPIFNVADSCITIGAVLLFLWPQHKVTKQPSG